MPDLIEGGENFHNSDAGKQELLYLRLEQKLEQASRIYFPPIWDIWPAKQPMGKK